MSAHNPLQSPGYSQVLRSTPFPATALDRHCARECGECQQRQNDNRPLPPPQNPPLPTHTGVCLERKIPHTSELCLQDPHGGWPGSATGREGGERKGCIFGVIRCYLRQGTDMSKKDRTYSPSGELMKQVNETENS